MGDPHNRKNLAVNRLRNQLKKKRESLADQFEFKMYIVFHFKEQKKSPALFEISEVVPVMTNNYEDCILKGVQDKAYSFESSQELLEKDIVQLHAPRWHPLRRDILGCTTDVDFLLWPRNDIEKIEGRLFSRWKGEDMSFKPVMEDFVYFHEDYDKQLARLVNKKERSALIINDPKQSMFLFLDKHHIQTTTNKMTVFKLSSVCLYLPQNQLTLWGPGTINDFLSTHLM